MRRRALIAAATAAFPVTAGAWQPPRPMRIVVPLAPGGTADTIARIIADPMAATLGQTVLIENRPGGNGSVAAIAVARGPADGLTLLYCSPSIQVLNPLMMRNIPYDAMADFTPVVALMRAPKVLVVRPDFPAQSVADLIALAKSRPGGLTYASAGIGSSAHLAGALFAQMAGIEMLHIPYRGTAPGVQDLMGGRVDMILDTAAALLPLVREGRLRALAVSTQDRAAAAPDLPPIAAINEAANHALADPSVRARFAALGAEPLGGTPAQLAAAVQEEIARWRGVIASQGITIE